MFLWKNKQEDKVIHLLFLYWTKSAQKHFESNKRVYFFCILCVREKQSERKRQSFNSFIMHLIECVWLYLAVAVAARELIDLSAHLHGDVLSLRSFAKHRRLPANETHGTVSATIAHIHHFKWPCGISVRAENHTFTILLEGFRDWRSTHLR